MLEPKAPALLESISSTLRHSISVAGLYRAALCLVLIVFAGIIAPGAPPSSWNWVGVLIAAAAAGMAVTLFGNVQSQTSTDNDEPVAMVVAAVLLGIAAVLSAVFSILTFVFAILILALVALHLVAHGPSSDAVFWILVGTLVPFWVWSAFDAWDRWLLMLVPTGIVGLVALEHALQSDLVRDSQRERYASWIGVAVVAAAFLIAALTIHVETMWLPVATTAVFVFAALDLTPVRSAVGERLPGVTLPALALLFLALGWLIAL